jgi:hypothetical protein
LEFLKTNWIKAPVLLYVLGFIVHNVYLSTFGSYEFELVQAKYILSGFGIVAFNAICFAYISIKVNLSYIFDSFQIDKLLPWLLRLVSLPYVIYSFLYLDSLSSLLLSEDVFIKYSFLLFSLANFVVFFSIFDLVGMLGEGDTLSARIIHSFLRILSIPMIILTFVFAYYNAEFLSIFLASSYLFFGFIGVGLRQEDLKHNIRPDYLDENAKNEHQDLFVIFFGIISIAFVLSITVSNYVKAIYPKLPVALGGAEIQSVQIHINDKVLESELIQETSAWTLYKNNKTGNIEKVKTSLVSKVITSVPLTFKADSVDTN